VSFTPPLLQPFIKYQIRAIAATINSRGTSHFGPPDVLSAARSIMAEVLPARCLALPETSEKAPDSLLPIFVRLLRPSAPDKLNPEGMLFKILSFWVFR